MRQLHLLVRVSPTRLRCSHITTRITTLTLETCSLWTRKTTATSLLSWKVFSSRIKFLVELGIDFSHILKKILVVLNPRKKIDPVLVNDADLTGPILFCFAISSLLLLVRMFVERLTSRRAAFNSVIRLDFSSLDVS